MILSAIARGIRGARSLWSAVKKPVPRGIKSVVKAAGGAAATVGSYAAADLIAQKIGNAGNPVADYAGMLKAGLPALRGVGGGGLPAIAGGALGAGLPDVLDASLLRTFYRAPRGYVIVKDPSSGQPFAVRKDIARRNKLWRPARKPPISAGDWHQFQTAKAVEKKLRKIAGPALRRHAQGRTPAKHKKGR
jgi:hypothetical protein